MNRRTGLAYALFSISLAACNSPPKLQPPRLTFGGIGGAYVNAIARGADGTTYLGGGFTSVSVVSGSGLAVDGASGLPRGGFPKVEGVVEAVIPDEHGGWYIGGLFRSVGGLACQNLAHLTSDSQVDPAWAPKVDGHVYALALQGGLVLIGGDFHNVGNAARRNLAAIDSSGIPTAWDPGASGRTSRANATEDVSRVFALAVKGSSIYVGGDFTTIGGGAHNDLAVVDTAGAASSSWVADASGPVHALLITATNLYVGGEFTTIGSSGGTSTELNGLASFTLADGELDQSWNPGLVPVDGSSATVYALAAIGNNLYVGGLFKGLASGGGGGGGGGTTSSTVLRSGLAALDASGKVLAAWDPALGVGGDTNPEVQALAASGNTLYVGGFFTSIGGTSRNFGAAVDGTSGALASWNPNVDHIVQALATRGDTVFIGGDFLGLGGFPRNHLAAIAPDGTLSDWNPNASGDVNALAVDGDTIYVGGQFQSVGGLGRANLAAIDRSGTVQAWNPGATSSTGSPTVVSTLALGLDAIYVGGSFDEMGAEARTNLASIDRAGQVTAWNPAEMATAGVTRLLVSGSDVFCAGANLGVFHYTSPTAVSDWNLPITNGAAEALALVSQNRTDSSGAAKVVTTLLVGGTFSTIGASGPASLAAIDVGTHDLSTVVALPTPDGGVSALAVADGTVYLAGYFTEVTSAGGTDAQERAGTAAFELATGALTPWQPDVYVPSVSGYVAGLTPMPGSVEVFGGFYSVDAKIGSGLALVAR